MPAEPTQPPIWNPPLSGRDAALVAGYILHYRQGIIEASDFFELAQSDTFPEWTVPMQRFYQDGERWTRFLLWWTGYRVAKNELWPQESMRDRP